MTSKSLGWNGDVTSFLQVPLRELDVRSWIGGGDNGIELGNESTAICRNPGPNLGFFSVFLQGIKAAVEVPCWILLVDSGLD